MSWLALILGVPTAAFLVCWAGFILVMKIRDRRDATTCGPCKTGWSFLGISLAFFVWILDVILNWTLFQVLGTARQWTISSRLKTIRRSNTTGWKRWVADMICEKMLNPHDDGHC